MSEEKKHTEPAVQPGIVNSPADAKTNVESALIPDPIKLPEVTKAAIQPPGVNTDKASLLSQTQTKPQPTKTLAGAIEEVKHPLPTAQPVKPYVFNETAFKDKVKKLETATNEVSGKPNYNPHLFLASNGFDDMIRQYKQGVRSQELFERMMHLPTTIPVVDENYVTPVPYKAELPKALQPPTRGK